MRRYNLKVLRVTEQYRVCVDANNKPDAIQRAIMKVVAGNCTKEIPLKNYIVDSINTEPNDGL
jgi:hypothetical protein